ncbi:unnamed protein product, partial [Prorocentrum cordatum]
ACAGRPSRAGRARRCCEPRGWSARMERMGVEEARAQPQVAWETTLVERDLQCPICIEFFCSPLRLRCGHTFCRLCLLQSTRLAPDGRSCPTCRTHVEIKDPRNEPTDPEIESRVRMLVPPEALEKRRAADAEELAALEDRERRRIPVFYMRGVASRPSEQVRLHFFEPRYKVLIRRAWEGNRRFLCAQKPPQEGDEVLLVEVDSAHFLPDGRANIRGVGRERVQVRHAWVEEGTDGLYYAEVDWASKDAAGVVPRQVSDEERVLLSLRAAIAVGAPAYNLGRVAACASIYAEAQNRTAHRCRCADAMPSFSPFWSVWVDLRRHGWIRTPAEVGAVVSCVCQCDGVQHQSSEVFRGISVRASPP